jgi:hypothetical protein
LAAGFTGSPHEEHHGHLDWHNVACVNWARDPWPGYIEGFRRAARYLVLQVDKTGRDQDFLVFPILFLYRHHLELQLKRLISRGHWLLGVDQPVLLGHDLRRLWTVCRAVLEEVLPGDATEALDVVGEHIQALAAVDPSAQAFRYPIDTHGRPSLPEQLTLLNLRHVAEQVEAANLLDGAGEVITAQLDAKLELEHLRAEYE